MSERTCPGCGGAISKRAELCLTCRKRAIAAGVSAVKHPDLITTGQMRAFHAKANYLDQVLERPLGTAKREAKDRAGVASARQLTADQASDILEWFDEQLAERGAAVVTFRQR